jgi:hypothetical protein
LLRHSKCADVVDRQIAFTEGATARAARGFARAQEGVIVWEQGRKPTWGIVVAVVVAVLVTATGVSVVAAAPCCAGPVRDGRRSLGS